MGISCVITHFFAFQGLTGDMIFEWLEFLVEVQTENNEKVPKIPRKYRNTEKYQKKGRP